MVKDALKKEVKIPALVLEGDVYDPRYYTKEQLRTRIESFAELVKAVRLSY
ncbi:MAG: 2-hydroxyacyl-CoA dehydratase [Desulfobacteraceae bacterium]|nr:MAG: 2-hydroxyacyl-CoA dehydratase [Desulfobacteraceae bacterium]